MTDPFNLEYGDAVTAVVKAVNYVGSVRSDIVTSTDVIKPYISGQLEFGYNEFGYYPFDKVNGRFPSAAQLLYVDADTKLTNMRIEYRITNHDTDIRLHGI